MIRRSNNDLLKSNRQTVEYRYVSPISETVNSTVRLFPSVNDWFGIGLETDKFPIFSLLSIIETEKGPSITLLSTSTSKSPKLSISPALIHWNASFPVLITESNPWDFQRIPGLLIRASSLNLMTVGANASRARLLKEPGKTGLNSASVDKGFRFLVNVKLSSCPLLSDRTIFTWSYNNEERWINHW